MIDGDMKSEVNPAEPASGFMSARRRGVKDWLQNRGSPSLLRLSLAAVLVGGVITLTLQLTDATMHPLAPIMGFVLLFGLAQMLFRGVPLGLSAAVGGVLFSLSAWLDPMLHGRFHFQPMGVLDWSVLVVGGAVSGYLAGALFAGMFLVAEQMLALRGRRVYAVPRRFGTGTLLLAMTLFAMLFAVLQWAQARPEQLFFYSAFVVTVSVAQMVFERSPRWASILAGGIYLPLSMLLIPLMRGRPMWRGVGSPNLLIWFVLGLFIGYLGGVLVAGVFLASDYVNRWLHREQPKPSAPS